jgi:hypothetical protein
MAQALRTQERNWNDGLHPMHLDVTQKISLEVSFHGLQFT